jgi:Dolichyl-phosphate-mannose-protein mannosyltransferase
MKIRRHSLSPDVLASAAVALFCSVSLAFAREHQIGGLTVETDFYGMYAPDAALIRRGLLPTGSFSGPGYPALLALLGYLWHDDFAAAKAISLIAAPFAAVGFYAAFRQVASARVALWMLLFLLSGSLFLQSAIMASADMLAVAFLAGALCFSFRPTGSRPRNYLLAGALTGLGYLTRGNAVVLVPAFLAALFIINPLYESLRARLKAATLYLAALTLVTAPWFWLCYRQTGTWIQNKNYLNVAMEMNGLDSSGDDFVQVVDRYHSMGDVIRENPVRFVTHVVRNAVRRISENLVWLVPFPLNQFVPAGLLLALLRLRRRRLAFALYPMVFYLALALVAGRTRYYLFLLPFYLVTGVALLTSLGRLADSGPLIAVIGDDAPPRADEANLPQDDDGQRSTVNGQRVSQLALALCLLVTLISSWQVMRDFLASEPRELANAAAVLRTLGHPGERVMARTAHVGTLAGLETDWLPDVPDMAALGRYLAARQSSYLVYGPAEQDRRPQLSALRRPVQAPRWLRPLYVSPAGEVALYHVVPEHLPEPLPGEQYVTPAG